MSSPGKRFLWSVLLPLIFGVIGSFIGISYFLSHENNHRQRDEEPLELDSSQTIKAISPALEQFENAFVQAAQLASPAVVHVQTQSIISHASPYRGSIIEFFFGRQPDYAQQVASSGSGVIVREDGYIVTNYHVIKGARQIRVTLNNKKVYSAELLAKDPATDLALLKVNTDNTLPSITFGKSDDLHVGSWVLAIGNPFDLESTVTAGIVSAKARRLRIESGKAGIESFIQVDAAVNPGNSGGALVDLSGKLVGINTAIASPTGTFAGYAFSIPETIVRKFVNDVITHGRVQRGILGVALVEMTDQLANQLNGGVVEGVLIQSLKPGAGADNAGLKPGDILIKIDGIPVNSISEIQEAVSSRDPGEKLTLDYVRNGEHYQTVATLTEL